jgi:RNA polymerase primary sigma factor
MKTLSHSLSPLEQARKADRMALAGSKRQLSLVDQATLRRVLNGKYEYVCHSLFNRPDAEKSLFDGSADLPRPDALWYRPALEAFGEGRSASAGDGSAPVLLKAAEERQLFLQYNFCRFCVCELRAQIGDGLASQAAARDLLRWHNRAQDLRDQIAAANLALVLAMAKRKRVSDVDWPDLISEGNMALLRAIDKFDVGRGFKFSTYGCRAILKAFSRAGIAGTKYRTMFPVGFDPALEKSGHQQSMREEAEGYCVEEIKLIFEENKADLTDVERSVIRHRFGIDRRGHGRKRGSPRTLADVGKIVGLTKERVRQIQNDALIKIRESLHDDFLQ